MKKVFSLVAVALLTVSILFTACRDNAATTETPATEAVPAPEAAPAPDASQATPADTTSQQAQ